MDSEAQGRRLRELRMKRGFGQSEFARMAGLHQSQISRLENGRDGLRSSTLLKLARILNVDPLYLCGTDIEGSRRLTSAPAEDHGLALSDRLRRALGNAEFVRLMETCADLAERHKKHISRLTREASGLVRESAAGG